MDDLGTCIVCEQRKNGWNSRRADGHVCRACYRRQFAPRERCGLCQRVGIINARPDGVPHCEACYKRVLNREACSRCGSERTVHARDERRLPVCLVCYERELAPREPCLFCETLQPASYRAPTGKAICRACYHRELLHAKCSRCGSYSQVATRTPAGDPLCYACSFAQRPREPCPLCGKRKPLLDCRNGERICRSCWCKHRQPQETCSSCGRDARVAEWRAPDRPVCPACWSRGRKASTGARPAPRQG